MYLLNFVLFRNFFCKDHNPDPNQNQGFEI